MESFIDIQWQIRFWPFSSCGWPIATGISNLVRRMPSQNFQMLPTLQWFSVPVLVWVCSSMESASHFGTANQTITTPTLDIIPKMKSTSGPSSSPCSKYSKNYCSIISQKVEIHFLKMKLLRFFNTNEYSTIYRYFTFRCSHWGFAGWSPCKFSSRGDNLQKL